MGQQQRGDKYFMSGQYLDQLYIYSPQLVMEIGLLLWINYL